MAKNDLSALEARLKTKSHRWFQEWHSRNHSGGVVTQKIVNQAVDLTGYLTLVQGDGRYVLNTTLTPILNGILESTHARQHNLLSTEDHTISGQTPGHVLKVLTPTSFGLQQLAHTDLGGVTENQHHNKVHALASTTALGADHTITGGVAGMTLRALTYSTAKLDFLRHDDIIEQAAEDHQKLATGGDGITVNGVGQVVSGNRSVLAFQDQENTFQYLQTLNAGLTSYDDVVIEGAAKVQDGLLVGTVLGDPTAMLDVRGTASITGHADIGTALISGWDISDSRIRSTSPAGSALKGTMITQTSVISELLAAPHGTLYAQTFEVESVVIDGGRRKQVAGGALTTLTDLAIPGGECYTELTDESDNSLTDEDGLLLGIAEPCTILAGEDGTELLDESDNSLIYETEFGLVRVAVKDPVHGHFEQLRIGDRVSLNGFTRGKSPGERKQVGYQWLGFGPGIGVNKTRERGIFPIEVWGTVKVARDQGDYFEYEIWLDREWPWDEVLLLAGAAVANYGNPSEDNPEGVIIYETEGKVGGPFIAFQSLTGDPWDGQTTVWLGRLAYAPGGLLGEVGLMGGTNLDDLLADRFVLSQYRFLLQNPNILIAAEEDGQAVVNMAIHRDGINFRVPLATSEEGGYVARSSVNELIWASDAEDVETATRYAEIYNRVSSAFYLLDTSGGSSPVPGWSPTPYPYSSQLVIQASGGEYENSILLQPSYGDIEQGHIRIRRGITSSDPDAKTHIDTISHTLNISAQEMTVLSKRLVFGLPALYTNTRSRVLMPSLSVGETGAEQWELYVDDNGFVKRKA